MALIKCSDVLCDDFDLFFCFIQASCVLLSCGLSSFDGHPAVIHAHNNFARVVFFDEIFARQRGDGDDRLSIQEDVNSSRLNSQLSTSCDSNQLRHYDIKISSDSFEWP